MEVGISIHIQQKSSNHFYLFIKIRLLVCHAQSHELGKEANNQFNFDYKMDSYRYKILIHTSLF